MLEKADTLGVPWTGVLSRAAVFRSCLVITIVTAMTPQKQSMVCQHASDKFTIVRKAFKYLQVYSNNLFFAVLDYDEASNVYKMLGFDLYRLFANLIHFLLKSLPDEADTV